MGLNGPSTHLRIATSGPLPPLRLSLNDHVALSYELEAAGITALDHLDLAGKLISDRFEVAAQVRAKPTSPVLRRLPGAAERSARRAIAAFRALAAGRPRAQRGGKARLQVIQCLARAVDLIIFHRVGK